jgi:signal transduction histidine kinase
MPVAEAAYFVVSEAVANMLKHAKARTASVSVEQSAGTLVVDVHDDGRGGADQSAGTGLAGIAARVRALDGSLSVHSPSGGPTQIHAEIPNATGDSHE